MKTKNKNTFSAKESKRLKRLLARNATEKPTKAVKSRPQDRSQALAARSRARLSYSRFRAQNEFLYSHSSSEANDFFSEDSFREYHAVYEKIADKWPQKPINHVIQRLATLTSETSGRLVVADIGCGSRAQLRDAFPSHFVHSFDLVADSPHVTAADMCSLPLDADSCDVAVFCLSLMATNLAHALSEANRVLKAGARLIIVEVASRFQPITEQQFARQMTQHFGFKLREQRHLSSDNFFVFFEFQKTAKCSQSLPQITLKSCAFKKR